MKVYSGYKKLPNAKATTQITEGCLVLEGGGWRGLYTQGALDALMEEGINFRRVIGVSAGALSAMGYLSGQIGICARINLKYRHDSDYCGLGAIINDKGVTGFTHFFRDIAKKEGFDWKRFLDPARSLAVSVTNLQTGQTEYMEKGSNPLSSIFYMRYPAFRDAMIGASKDYNLVAEELEADEAAGRIFMQAPKDPVHIKKFEGDTEKLGDLYFRGYNEMKEKIPALRAYLGDFSDEEKSVKPI